MIRPCARAAPHPPRPPSPEWRTWVPRLRCLGCLYVTIHMLGAGGVWRRASHLCILCEEQRPRSHVHWGQGAIGFGLVLIRRRSHIPSVAGLNFHVVISLLQEPGFLSNREHEIGIQGDSPRLTCFGSQLFSVLPTEGKSFCPTGVSVLPWGWGTL